MQRFAPNVTRGGVFIASRDPRPVEALIRFEISLADGAALLAGEGRVTWVRPYDPAAPTKPHGMGVQFTTLDAESRPMLERLLAARGGGSQPKPVPKPRPKTAIPPPPVAAQPEPRPRVPTVDPAAFSDFDEGVEESAIRRARDFAKILGAREDDPDALLDDLLKPDSETQVSKEEAVAGIASYLQTRRKTGLWRVLPEEGSPREVKPEETRPAGSSNGAERDTAASVPPAGDEFDKE